MHTFKSRTEPARVHGKDEGLGVRMTGIEILALPDSSCITLNNMFFPYEASAFSLVIWKQYEQLSGFSVRSK